MSRMRIYVRDLGLCLGWERGGQESSALGTSGVDYNTKLLRGP